MKTTKTKSARIALIGWGSLINNKKAKLSIGPWNANGPEIPIEFARVSKDGRLVPIIDEKNGIANKVFFTVSKHKNVAKALDELVEVEKISPNRIGVINIRDKSRSECTGRQPKATMAIAEWAKKNNIDIVLWNSLGTKFKQVINVPFSPEAALKYVEDLPKKESTIARKYIASIPKNIKTKVRELIEKA